jgi:flagellar hook-basal body complex protein FliE
MQTDLASFAANAVLPSPSASPAGRPDSAASPGSTPFANVLREAMANVKGLEEQASGMVEGLVAGRGVDIHAAMIATQKSDLAFEMALAVRGKAVAAYQSLMSVQF